MAREITYLVRALKVDQGVRLNTDTPINALRSIVQRESATNLYDLDDIRGVSPLRNRGAASTAWSAERHEQSRHLLRLCWRTQGLSDVRPRRPLSRHRTPIDRLCGLPCKWPCTGYGMWLAGIHPPICGGLARSMGSVRDHAISNRWSGAPVGNARSLRPGLG
jgi:hypothetical protein